MCAGHMTHDTTRDITAKWYFLCKMSPPLGKIELLRYSVCHELNYYFYLKLFLVLFLSNKANIEEKIPHTGDKASLD